MARNQVTPAGLYVQELLEKFPDAPALTLAKKAYRECPQLWSSVETCRGMIRDYLGARGGRRRKEATVKRHYREPRKAGWTGVIPEAVVQLPDWEPLQVDGPVRALVLNDVHIPFHDPQALELALEHGETQRPNVILLNGDISDHFGPSKYEKDPRLRDFPAEVLAVKQFLAGLRSRFGRSCRIIYKLGNHEERYESYMITKCIDFLGIPEFEWENVFGLREQKIELVKHKRPIRLGELNVLHGHEYTFNISSPVSASRGIYLRAGCHAATGHFHRSDHYSKANLEGKLVTVWSVGCLCDLRPAYRPINDWGQGFAFVEIEKDGAFHVENYRIVNGKVY